MSEAAVLQIGPLILVGEAPGADQDMKGIPFVGRSGRLLNETIQKVTEGKYGLDNCYRTNVLKYRPAQ